MKKTYNELSVEVLRFAAEDVITTSNETPEVPLFSDEPTDTY